MSQLLIGRCFGQSIGSMTCHPPAVHWTPESGPPSLFTRSFRCSFPCSRPAGTGQARPIGDDHHPCSYYLCIDLTVLDHLLSQASC